MSDPHAAITGQQLLDVWYKDHAGGPGAGGKPHIFWCCGLHSSGSTWMFNLAREICRSQAVDFVSCHRESVAKLPRDALESRLIVVKSHTPMDDLRWLLANSSEPVVITVRDPRDAVVSLLQRFGNGFGGAVNLVAVSAERLVTLSRLRAIPIFRYEDGFIGRVETFDRIAALLGMSPSADQREAILAELEPESVKRTISDLIAAGVIRPSEKVHDPKTLWHAHHVADGRIGKFIGVLSPVQQFEIAERTREFCDCFGYDVTVDASPERHSYVVSISAEQMQSSNLTHGSGDGETPGPEPRPGEAAEGGMKTIGLCMIVRNEARLIRQCLTSALPLVDYVLVVDTGSEDGTQQIIRDFLAEHDVPGAVIDEPWRDFAYNRTFALDRLREVEDIDYALIIDADDIVVLDAGFDPRAFKTRMGHDLYDVQVLHGGMSHFRAQICRNRLPFSFKGVVHEYLEVPAGASSRVNGRGIFDPCEHGRRAQSKSPEIPGRRGVAGARAGERDRPFPDLALHILSGAELEGLRRAREGVGQLSEAGRARLLGRGDLHQPPRGGEPDGGPGPAVRRGDRDLRARHPNGARARRGSARGEPLLPAAGQERRRPGIRAPRHRADAARRRRCSFNTGSTTTAFSTSSPSMPIGRAPIASRSMRR